MTTTTTTATPSRQPAWLKYDSLKLGFHGYFEDLESTVRTGMRRIRRCHITYHLEDDTVDVREPKGVNSGIVQGQILHRIKATSREGVALSPLDFVVGKPIEFFSRTYHVLGCDAFTRGFVWKEFGVELGPELAFPEERDPPPPREAFPSAPSITAASAPLSYAGQETNKTKKDADAVAKKMHQSWGLKESEHLKESAGRQFLELDRNVLRFFATAQPPAGSDDTTGDTGLRTFIFHYFLADDTVEVLEVMGRNSGREPFPKLLRRQKLPKHGSYGVGIRPASEDTLRKRSDNTYHWSELRVGDVVNVFGRELTLRDCDEHTRGWYEERLGLTAADFSAMPPPPGPPPVPRMPPPPNLSGIGSEEDSLQSCFHLVPKPQKTVDFNEWALNQGQVMRFTASFSDSTGEKPEFGNPSKPLDRALVVSYFLEDHSVSVYEPPVKNSGLPGGVFMKRRPVKKNGDKDGPWLRARDFYVGATLELSGRAVTLNAADEWTLAVMESKPSEFPKSDSAKVIAGARSVVGALGKDATDALRAAAAAEDGKLCGGGGFALSFESFVAVMLACPGIESGGGDFFDAQSLLTLWRSLPKVAFDPAATRAPKLATEAELNGEYVRIKDLLEAVGVL